jgi:hypothetical protein
MQKLSIRKAAEPDEALYELLLLADPSREIVDDYLVRGECYTAWTSDLAPAVFRIPCSAAILLPRCLRFQSF